MGLEDQAPLKTLSGTILMAQSLYSWPYEPSELLKGKKRFELPSLQNDLGKGDWTALKNL